MDDTPTVIRLSPPITILTQMVCSRLGSASVARDLGIGRPEA